MPKKTRFILAMGCLVVNIVLGVALAFYTLDYMSFEDGKLSFHFGSTDTGTGDPNTPTGPDTPEDPDEPEIPKTIYTIHLSFPNGTTQDYMYNSISGSFNVDEKITAYENATATYSFFDGWYTDNTYTAEIRTTQFRDNMTIYGKFSEAIDITIYGAKSTTLTTSTKIKTRKNSLFNVAENIEWSGSAVHGVYSDADRETKIKDSFIANEAKTIYLSYATAQSSFTFSVASGKASLDKFTGSETEIL